LPRTTATTAISTAHKTCSGVNALVHTEKAHHDIELI
jgi:hypothetical protein